jgi:hypothetical protein
MDELNLVDIGSRELHRGQRYYFEFDPPLGDDDPNYDPANPNLNINRRIGNFMRFVTGQDNTVHGYIFGNISFADEPQLPPIPEFEYHLSDGHLIFRGNKYKSYAFEGAGTRRKSRRNTRLKRRKSRRSKKTRNNRRSSRRRRSMRGG